MEEMFKGICILWYTLITLLAFISTSTEMLFESLCLLWLGVIIVKLDEV